MEGKLTCMIVDDEPNSVELLAAYLSDLYNNIEITAKCYSWKDALNVLRAGQPDILLLDISLPGKSGIDMLKLISDIDFEVIFITAHAEFALDAFRFFATGYLLKPVDETEFAVVIDKAIERIARKKDNTGHSAPPASPPLKLGIPNSKGIDYVNLADILYFESNNKYTKVITSSSTLISPYHIGAFRKLITSDLFFSVHQSYIVNMMHVVRYDSNGYIVMPDKREIPVARSVKKEFLQHFITATKLK